MVFLTTIIGLFLGLIYCGIAFNNIFFNIPLTAKLSKMNFVNKPEITKGSVSSIILSSLIILSGWLLTYFLFKGELPNYLFAVISAGLYSFFKQPKSNKMKVYFEKHHSYISPALLVIAYNEKGFDYRGVVSFLRTFIPHAF